jgi:hypothetical protein
MERISSFFLMGYAPGHDLEPRFSDKSYFHIYWSKSKIFFAHVLKKDVLLLCA